eukprot:510675_1
MDARKIGKGGNKTQTTSKMTEAQEHMKPYIKSLAQKELATKDKCILQRNISNLANWLKKAGEYTHKQSAARWIEREYKRQILELGKKNTNYNQNNAAINSIVATTQIQQYPIGLGSIASHIVTSNDLSNNPSNTSSNTPSNSAPFLGFIAPPIGINTQSLTVNHNGYHAPSVGINNIINNGNNTPILSINNIINTANNTSYDDVNNDLGSNIELNCDKDLGSKIKLSSFTKCVNRINAELQTNQFKNSSKTKEGENDNNTQSFIRKLTTPNLNEYKTWTVKQIIKWISSLDNGKYVKFANQLDRTPPI